ncbi:MAG: 3'-5' exonuclease, partial [Oscillospiraceae bacterium]|nr:3'-5' exonuclease [Oscillospiraceae bacterium]
MVANEVLELGGGLSLTVSFPPASVDRPKREEKGKSLLDLAESFVVLDFETTGLDPMYDEIIEIGAIRVVAGKAENEYTTLIKPKSPIGSFITDLTGITNDMVKDAPVIESALPGLLEFIGNDVVVGHNTHFDINFLYDCCVKYLKIPFTNNLIDTMRIARNAFKDADGYRLADMADYFKVESKPKHRAINDCRCTLDV